MILASGFKGPGNEKPTGYWSDLLRGFELEHGIETPLLNHPQVAGREDALRQMWKDAPLPDRYQVESDFANLMEEVKRCDEELAKEKPL